MVSGNPDFVPRTALVQKPGSVEVGRASRRRAGEAASHRLLTVSRQQPLEPVSVDAKCMVADKFDFWQGVARA